MTDRIAYEPVLPVQGFVTFKRAISNGKKDLKEILTELTVKLFEG
jgi:hypothetical protein